MTNNKPECQTCGKTGKGMNTCSNPYHLPDCPSPAQPDDFEKEAEELVKEKFNAVLAKRDFLMNLIFALVSLEKQKATAKVAGYEINEDGLKSFEELVVDINDFIEERLQSERQAGMVEGGMIVHDKIMGEISGPTNDEFEPDSISYDGLVAILDNAMSSIKSTKT